MPLEYVKPKDIIKSSDWNYLVEVSKSTPENKTSERHSGSVYHNDSNHSLFVSVIQTNQVSNENRITARISPDGSNWITISEYHITAHDGSFYCNLSVNFIVPAGWYYKCESSANFVWYEQYIW